MSGNGSYYNNGAGPTSAGGTDVSATIVPGSTVLAVQSGVWNVSILAGSTVAATQSGVWNVALSAGAAVAATQAGAWSVSLSGTPDVNALPAAAVSGGAGPYTVISLATTNTALVKTGAANLYGFTLANTNATLWRYLKVFDKATMPVPGTDTPVAVIPLPPGAAVSRDMPVGMSFIHGLGIAITADPALTDATVIAANEVVGTLEYA
jgi:hypothetical protein